MNASRGDVQRAAVVRALGEAQRRVNQERYQCLFPGCIEIAIQSHAQSQAAQLASIAENEWVYAIQTNHYQTARNRPVADPIQRVRPGNASTFPGFCRKHDAELFRDVDTNNLVRGSQNQAKRLFLRAIAHEYAIKRKMVLWDTVLLEAGGDAIPPEVREFMTANREGKQLFVDIDGPAVLARAFGLLDSDDRLMTCWDTIPSNIGISCTCCISPLVGDDRNLQLNANSIQTVFSASIVPGAAQTHIVASWLPEDDEYSDWITVDFTSTAGLESFVNRIAFAECDDTCIRPSLWEGLNRETQFEIFRAIMPNFIRDVHAAPRIIQLQ